MCFRVVVTTPQQVMRFVGCFAIVRSANGFEGVADQIAQAHAKPPSDSGSDTDANDDTITMRRYVEDAISTHTHARARTTLIVA